VTTSRDNSDFRRKLGVADFAPTPAIARPLGHGHALGGAVFGACSPRGYSDRSRIVPSGGSSRITRCGN
jgi:hypothetical protein